MPVATTWEYATARAAYRATMQRIAAWWNDEADIFDRPSLKRADIRAARHACEAAWRRQDLPALTVALGRWEAAITGRQL